MATKRKSKSKRKRGSARKAAEQRSRKGSLDHLNLPSDVNLFEVKAEGNRHLDIIPYVTTDANGGNPAADEGSDWYERTYYTHRNIGPGRLTLVCPARTANKKCPICEAAARAFDDDDEDTGKALRAKARQLFNVIDLKDKDKGIQVWEFSQFLFGEKLDDAIKLSDAEDGYDDFFFPEAGKALKVSFKEEMIGKGKYYECANIDFVERAKQYPDDYADEAHNLDDMLEIKSYKELKAILLQIDEEDDEDEEPKEEKVEKPKTKPKTRKPKPKPEPEPVEVDDEEDEDDDWDDEDEDDDDGGAEKEDDTIEVGDYVAHPKWGDCEVVAVGDGGLMTIKDEKDKRHQKVKPADVELLADPVDEYDEEDEDDEDDDWDDDE